MLTAIDLFAGAGGATQGLSDVGFTVLAAVENDDAAVVTYCLNHNTPVVLAQDIQTVKPAWLLESLGLEEGGLDLLNACPPCQGWSSLGKNDVSDIRNNLVDDVGRLILWLRPKSWVLENVRGLAKDPRLDRLVEQAIEVGYDVKSYELDAQALGVPQRRRRLIVVGIYGRTQGTLPEDILCMLPATFDRKPRTAGDAIQAVATLTGADDAIHRARRLGPRVAERIAAIPVGGNRFDLPLEYRLDCHERMGSRQASAAYGRIRAHEPAPTMTTRCTTPACGSFVHPTENRGITLREAALIQSFPKDYAFFGTYGQIEAQIGNAFPPRMAEGIGAAVKELLSQEIGHARR